MTSGQRACIKKDERRSRPRDIHGRPGRRRVRVWLAVVLALATLSVVGATAPISSRSSIAGAASLCTDDGANGCIVTLPCATSPCPSIDVSPVTNINDGQYLYVKSHNFDPTGSMRVALCATNSSATDPWCVNGVWETRNVEPLHVPVTNDATQQNLTGVAYPAFSNPGGQGNSPMPAHDILNVNGLGPGFFCDNTANPCSLVVTEEAGQGNVVGYGPAVSASNSAVIPLNFVTQSGGCPSSDPVVQTDSGYSLEHFMPAAVEATCTGGNGVVALNTANDNLSVASDFANGGTNVAFIDNASDPTELGTLLGRGYSLIPVAVSATSVGFLAGRQNGPLPFPVADFNMTPNMVAGLITSQYQSPQGTLGIVNGQYVIQQTDNLIAPAALDCALLLGCANKNPVTQLTNELKYDTFDTLNPVVAPVTAPTQLGSFMSNIDNGASYQVTNWICQAPNTPFPVQVDEVGQSNPVTVTVTDPNLASATMTTPPVGSSIWPPFGDPTAPWVFPQCKGYSTFPALSATNSNYSESQSPAFQAKAIRSWAFAGGSLPQSPLAAFGVMDYSEASFYGLGSAKVENASGAFVAPSVQSIELAANELTPCPGGDLTCPPGTYAINYGNQDPAAYPMPDVTYAAVPTTALPPATASAVKNLLTNLVTYSHSGALPTGYVPLPTGMYQSALSEIGADVASQPVTDSTTTDSSTASSDTGSSATSGGGQSSSSTSSTENGGFGSSALLPFLSSDPSSPGSGSGRTGTSARGPGGPARAASTGPTGFLLVSLDAAARFLLPAFVVLAIACLIAGPLLAFGPETWRRRRKTEGPS